MTLQNQINQYIAPLKGKAQNMKHTNYRKHAIAVAVGLTIFVGSASAQELETITVTSQKRVENIQDVPISIQALSGADLAATGAVDFETLSDALINVDISTVPGIKKISIRGLGSGSGNPAFEQSVGLYIDGIYASRVDLFAEPFMDIERLEVLKGPQGVLFGKNSIAGALAIISAKPSDTFEGSISGNYEFEHDSYQVTGVLTGPLTDNLSARIAVRQASRGAYMENAGTGPDAGEDDNTTIRGSLLWEASDNTEVYLKVEHSDVKETGSPFEIFADYTPGSLPSILNTLPQGIVPELEITEGLYHGSIAGGEDFILDSISHSNVDQGVDQQSDNVTLQVTHNIGEHELVYIGAYASFDKATKLDSDFSAVAGVATADDRDFNQTSHELRIVSPKGETFEYIAGLYYLDREFNTNLLTDAFGYHPFLQVTGRGIYAEESTSKAVFAQGTWNISEKFRVSAGVRYSEDDKDAKNAEERYEYQTTTPLAGLNPFKYAVLESLFGPGDWSYTDSISEDSFDPSVNAQWDINDDTMAYINLTKATKSGGFDASESLNNPSVFAYKPEEATGFELGMKMDLLDGRGRLNVAIFKTDFDDLQVSSFVPSAGATGSFVTTNAGKAISQGVEMDGLFAVSDNLTVGANVGYLSSEYDEFFTACAANAIEAATLNCVMIDGVLQKDLSGFQTNNAPKWTGSVFAEYSTTIGEMNAGVRLDANYKDETSIDPSQDSNLIVDSYTKVNVNFTLESDNWSVGLGVFNLTDEQPITFGGQAFAIPGAYWVNRGRGREVKATFTYWFE